MTVHESSLDEAEDLVSFSHVPIRPISRVKARPVAVFKLALLHSRSDVDAIIQRESARCERTGHEFSLVIIGAADSGVARHVPRLAKLLCRRARSTDEIGWFDEQRLCVVLPDTNADGALDFVRQFAEASYFQALSPTCHVLTYPSQGDSEPIDTASIALGLDALQQANNGQPLKVGNLAPLLIRPLPLWKRVIDLVVASVALVLALPVMALAAMAIKLTDRGPVFFSQMRAGLGGRPFKIYKFRTMIVDAEHRKAQLRRWSEQDGPAFKIKHDPRITRIGRLLRETSMDELPQLLNVLRGEMSLVGPRPLPLDESDQCDIWHRRRLDVTPGLTCTWQVKGRSKVTFAEWIRMDRTYIGRRSFWQDLKLMFMTVPSVLLRRGAR